jgi:hypothetical protein
MITDANYAFAGRNTMYFVNNDNENPKNPLIHLVVDDNINSVKPEGTNVNTKYNGFAHTFKPMFPSCCSTYIDFMPYIREQILKWYYGKVQLLAPETQFESFLKNLDMLITQVQVFPKNIRVGVHVKYDNASLSSPVVIQELSSFHILKLPDTEMIGRMADTRVGYFTVNNDLITKFRLPDDGYFIKVYMDPSIPLKYKTELSGGIEKYNDLFEQVIGKRPLKFIAYDDTLEFPDDYDVWGAAMNGYQKLPHPNVNVDFDNMETILGERKRYLVSWVKKIGEWREVLYSATDIHVHPIDDAIEIRENITAFLYENAGLPEEAEILITAVYTL